MCQEFLGLVPVERGVPQSALRVQAYPSPSLLDHRSVMGCCPDPLPVLRAWVPEVGEALAGIPQSPSAETVPEPPEGRFVRQVPHGAGNNRSSGRTAGRAERPERSRGGWHHKDVDDGLQPPGRMSSPRPPLRLLCWVSGRYGACAAAQRIE